MQKVGRTAFFSGRRNVTCKGPGAGKCFQGFQQEWKKGKALPWGLRIIIKWFDFIARV